MAMDGWQSLGAAFANNPQNSFNTGVTQGLTQAGLLEKARADRNKNLAIASVTPDVINGALSGDPVKQSVLISAAAQAGMNPDELINSVRGAQGLTYQGATEALAAVPGADQNLLNNRNIALNGKPVELTKLEGGMSFNPQVTPNSPSQSMNLTQVGSADVMLKGAQAGEAGAAAGKDVAQTGLARAQTADVGQRVVDGPNGPVVVNILRPGASSAAINGPDGKPLGNKPTASGSQDLTTTDYQALGATDPTTGKVNPLKAQAYSAWQQQQAAQDPRFNNKAFAMAQFQQKQMEAAQNRPPMGPNVMAGVNDTQGNPITKPFSFVQPPPAPVGAAAALGGAAPAAPSGAAGAMSGNGPLPPGVSPQGDYTPPVGVVQPTIPAGNPLPSQAPPSKIPGVSRASNGAYLPATAADYAKLPPGAAYIKPGESVVRTKKAG